MYYEKLGDVPSLPEHLKLACIELAEYNLKNNVPMPVWYSRYETSNKNSISYIPAGEEFVGSDGQKSGGVGFYNSTAELTKQLSDYYTSLNHPFGKNIQYFIQIVIGSSFVAPHIDNPAEREHGFLYLLKAGGNNVKTRWYEINEEYKHAEVIYNTAIPYDRLTLVEEHCLEENTWHWMNFSKAHSVENQESTRIALWGITEPMGYIY